MTYCVIAADNSWVAGPVDEEPVAETGERVLVCPFGFPTMMAWSPERGAFVDIVQPSSMLTIGRFKLLMTQAERIAIRAAATSNPAVEDFLDLLNGFTDGISLADPVLVGAINSLVPAGLLTADRAAKILAGTSGQ